MTMQFTLQAWPRLRVVLNLLAGAVMACHLGTGITLALLLIVGEAM